MDISCREARLALIENGEDALYGGQFSNGMGKVKRSYSMVGNHWRSCEDCLRWWYSINPLTMSQKASSSERDINFEPEK